MFFTGKNQIGIENNSYFWLPVTGTNIETILFDFLSQGIKKYFF